VLVMAGSFRPQAMGTGLVSQGLYDFGANPKNPRAGLVQCGDGNFYGTTAFGGTNGENGTVFQISPAGMWTNLTILHSFQGSDGALPWAGLVQGSDGLLYGTTERGGTNSEFGTVFKIATTGEFTVLHNFEGSDGSFPRAALVQGRDGNYYGTTAAGGANGDNGTVFRITTNGVLDSLFSFNGTNGSRPLAGLIQSSDGNFYGTTSAGGPDYNGTPATGNGAVFRITGDGTLASLFFFHGTNGSDPEACLAEGSDGAFYGTTQAGGANGDNGTVFKITAAGVLTTLYSFGGADGNYPVAGLAAGSDGDFYGTTAGDNITTFGTVFRLTPRLTTLFSFDGTNGASPVAGLTLGMDGNLYGTTFEGGSGRGGTIFRLVEAPVIKAILPSNGSVVVTWNSFTNGTYRVEHTPALGAPKWVPLAAEVMAAGMTTSATYGLEGASQVFFRVRLLP